jgi:single-strand DNA-binding protein
LGASTAADDDTIAAGFGGHVQYLACAVFGETAEFICRTLYKNEKLYIEGSIRLEEWTGRDGDKRTGLSVVANRAEPPAIGRNKPKRASAANNAEPAQRPSMLSA